MMKTFLITCALFIANIAWAGGTGTSIGNGGVGIMENGKLYVLDLYENGVHDRPVFGTLPLVHWLPQKMEDSFANLNLSPEVKNLLMQKISDVMRVNYRLGFSIYGASEVMEWRLVSSELVRLNDENSAIDPINLVQIAVRQGAVVFVDRAKWNLLDDANKVALLIHETLYALSRQDTAVDARMVTGEIFTEQFLRKGFSQISLRTVYSLPLNEIKKYADLIFRSSMVNPYPLVGTIFPTASGSNVAPRYMVKDFRVAKKDGKFVIVGADAQAFCSAYGEFELNLVMRADVYRYAPSKEGVASAVSEYENFETGTRKTFKVRRDQKKCVIDFAAAIKDYEAFINKEYRSYQ